MPPTQPAPRGELDPPPARAAQPAVPPVRAAASLGWSLALIAASLAVWRISGPLLEWLGFSDVIAPP